MLTEHQARSLKHISVEDQTEIARYGDDRLKKILAARRDLDKKTYDRLIIEKALSEKELLERDDLTQQEQLSLAGRHAGAIGAWQRYLAQYPTGGRSARATFYLAESLRATGRLESAADNYQKVIQMGSTACLEDATAAYADIQYDLQHYSQAAEAYERLFGLTKDDTRRRHAREGLMRSSFGAKDYEAVIATAREVGTREADYLAARSYRTMGQREKALQVFEKLSSDCSDAYGAESAYILVLEAYDKGDFAQVERRVYAFSDSGTGQSYWLAKSYIILGDSFADRGDREQAEATFNSILDGYVPVSADDDVVEQVRSRLNMLKTMMR